MSAQSSSHYQKGTDEKWVCFNDKTCPKAQFEVILLWEIYYCYLAVFGMSVYQAILNYLFLCKRDILRMFPCQPTEVFISLSNKHDENNISSEICTLEVQLINLHFKECKGFIWKKKKKKGNCALWSPLFFRWYESRIQ